MDIVNPDIYRRSYFDNRYALLLTPNAYCDMLMRIFTPYLIFQCVFTDFQCVITLLRALSVALLQSLSQNQFGMEQRSLYKSYFIFCILMRPGISFLKSKKFQLFVKKKFSLLYPDRGIVPRLVPFSSLFNIPFLTCIRAVLTKTFINH